MSLQIETKDEQIENGAELSRREELELLEMVVFGMLSEIDYSDDAPHAAWKRNDESSRTKRSASLVIDGEIKPYAIEHFKGGGLDMPDFQVLKYDESGARRLIYQGYLDNAIEAGIRRAEKELAVDQSVGAYALVGSR